MDVSVSEIIRETRNAINSRLDMLEVLINKYSSFPTYSNPLSNVYAHECDNHRIDYLNSKISELYTKINKLEERLENNLTSADDDRLKALDKILPFQRKEGRI